MTRPRHSLARIFAWPAAAAAASAVGLAAGLVGDGAWDRAAWAGLALPVVLCWPAMRRAQRPTNPLVSGAG